VGQLSVVNSKPALVVVVVVVAVAVVAAVAASHRLPCCMYGVCNVQSPDEHESETAVKSKEARKYIFNNLDDMAQVCITLFKLTVTAVYLNVFRGVF